MEQIKVAIQGQSYSVIGGDFWTMLETVKAIPGRQFIQKIWHLPISLDEARATLAPLQIVDEDGLLEAEIADIQRVQIRLLELKARIEQRVSRLDGEVASYSRNSKSSIKYGLAKSSSMLSYALQYAALPIEKLTEPQIKTLYAALREMEG